MKPSDTEGLVSVLEDIAETAAVYGDEQQRTVGRVKYAHKFVDQLIREAVRETEKAFGGCKKCYGKGYATVIEGMEVMNRHYAYQSTPPHKQIKYCICERGEQLASLKKEG